MTDVVSSHGLGRTDNEINVTRFLQKAPTTYGTNVPFRASIVPRDFRWVVILDE